MLTATVIVPLSIHSAAEALYTSVGREGTHNLTVLLGPEDGEPTHVAMCPRETTNFRDTLLAVMAGGPPPPDVDDTPEFRAILDAMIVYFDPPAEGVEQPAFQSDREFFLWAVGQQGLVMMGYVE